MLKVKEVTISESEKRDKKTIVYFWPEGESVLENLANRRNRPYTEYRKLLPEVFKELRSRGINLPDNPKANWSQKAGCSCGCSPGFILPDYHSCMSIHVTVVME